MNWGWTLEDYVEYLLGLGKKRDAEEFKVLFEVFGKDKVVTIAKAILAKQKKEKDAE